MTNAGIEPNEAKAETRLLLEAFCNFTSLDIAFGRKLDESKLELAYEKAVERVESGKPIQHIIGWAYFMGERYYVNGDVLIPRDETEILADLAITTALEKRYRTVLDIGTGSGCIACAIAGKTDCQVLGTDISTNALRVALANAENHNLCNKAIFRKSDIFSNVRTDEKFDIIVSNPPYIPLSEKPNLQKEVLFDPELALFTDDKDGLQFYKKIISQAKDFLNPNGFLMFEAGQNQAASIVELMDIAGFKEIQVIKDLANIDRVISGHI